MNGDAIRFGVDGALQDGQHRLWAIFEAEVPVESLVVRGLPAEAQESMDLGSRRNLRDVLALRGEANATALAAILNYHWRFTTDHIRQATVKPTIPQALRHLDAHPALRDSLLVSKRLRQRLSISPAMLGTFVYEARSIDQEQADHFMGALDSGAMLSETSPIYVLRRHLEQQQLQQGHPSTGQLVTLHALFIKAWNAYRNGQEIERLTWRAAGANPEPFPVML